VAGGNYTTKPTTLCLNLLVDILFPGSRFLKVLNRVAYIETQ
jgi:hypothetical protein